MSSAYVVSDVLGGGAGTSDVYRLNNAGESTPPCGTPVLIFCFFEEVLLYIENA